LGLYVFKKQKRTLTRWNSHEDKHKSASTSIETQAKLYSPSAQKGPVVLWGFFCFVLKKRPPENLDWFRALFCSS